MSIKGSVFSKLTTVEAVDVAREAEVRLMDMDLPGELKSGWLASVQTAIAERSRQGLQVDYSSREEVVGLVSAVMGGYDHLTKARIALNRYVASIVQTGEIIENWAGLNDQQSISTQNEETTAI